MGVEVAVTDVRRAYTERWLLTAQRCVKIAQGCAGAISHDVAGLGGRVFHGDSVRGVCGLGGLVFLQAPAAEGVNGIDIPQEWGIVGFVCAILLSMLGLFTWWVRGARQDQREATKALVSYLSDEAKATSTTLTNMTVELKLDRNERQEFQARLLEALQHVCRYHKGDDA